VSRARSNLLPYALLAPGLLWLVIFFAVPLYYMAEISLKTGSLETGYSLTWHFETYTDSISNYQDQLLRSFEYAALSTLIALVIAFPLAYVIAFRGGRYKNALLLLVILPFFITYLVRTLSWQTILDDSGWIVSFLQTIGLVSDDGRLLATSTAVIAGITYNYLPFMILPLYAALERTDPRMLEAGYDLYGRRRDVIGRVVVPMAIPGIVAGVLLTFIPAFGDYVNAAILGSPNNAMIGNKIQSLYLVERDYPEAAALSFLMMAAVLVSVLVYIRVAGTEAFMGDEEESRS
jgi:spermidine/putrescine transport system permease protein